MLEEEGETEVRLRKDELLGGPLTIICRFIVMQKSVIKYMTKIGQNTGTSKTSKKVHIKPITVLLTTAYQNLNSGRRRMNGRNSSFAFVGSSGPPSSAEYNFKEEVLAQKWEVMDFIGSKNIYGLQDGG